LLRWGRPAPSRARQVVGLGCSSPSPRPTPPRPRPSLAIVDAQRVRDRGLRRGGGHPHRLPGVLGAQLRDGEDVARDLYMTTSFADLPTLDSATSVVVAAGLNLCPWHYHPERAAAAFENVVQQFGHQLIEAGPERCRIWPGRTPRSPPRRSTVLRCPTACRACGSPSTAGHVCRPVRWSDLRVIGRLSCKALTSAWCGSKMLTLTTATDSGECNHVASEWEFVAARSGAFGGDGNRLQGVVIGEHVD
jgi:hypothetical protein